jgi:two-component system cell cycle response regulator DivK
MTAAGSSAGRVLLVEDNERNLKLARDVLGFHGFDVTVASTAEEGVAKAVADPPDLILMDIQLPGMDGYAALDALRSDDRTAKVPVVALTALVMRADRERIVGAGFDGYLQKPISVREFPEQVRAHLDAGRPAGTQP